ncbi:MAG: hypothetical protein QF733_07695 [Phycisphaerales bacterium]|jgi:hypothetical protein|nr:hypothetical protein [Phycisphaerales bacterium]
MHRGSATTVLAWAAAIAVALVWMSRPGTMMHPEAHAGMSASRGGFTLLTAGAWDQRVAVDGEVVYLMDHHRGMMLVYTLSDLVSTPHIELLDGGRIEVLFERARGHGRGTPTP